MLLLIDNYDSFTYNLYQLLALTGANIQVIRNDTYTLKDIVHIKPKGIVLSPGPGRPEKAGICMPLITAILEKTLPPIPILGVCLGHQAIVAALGGRVIEAPSIVHGKSTKIYHQSGLLYESLPNPFEGARYHSLIADPTLPETLMIEASSSDNLIMGVRHHIFPIFGVQFHPESILTPEGSLLIKAFNTLCETRSRNDSSC